MRPIVSGPNTGSELQVCLDRHPKEIPYRLTGHHVDDAIADGAADWYHNC